MSEKKETEVVEKKRPRGRPRLTPLPPAINKKGVAMTPSGEGNHSELVFDAPSNFKRAMLLFKAHSPKELHFSFTHSALIISARNHVGTSRVYCKFQGANMVHYYCREPISFTLKMKNVAMVVGRIDAKYVTTSIFIQEVSLKQSVQFVFRNKLGMDENFTIKMITATAAPPPPIEKPNMSLYPIEFTMDSSYFKKFVNDTFSDSLTISKVGANNQLRFTYESGDRMISANLVVKDEEALDLRSAIDGRTIFSTTLRLEYAAPLAKALIGKYINVQVSEKEDILFSGNMSDGAISVTVACQIIDLS